MARFLPRLRGVFACISCLAILSLIPLRTDAAHNDSREPIPSGIGTNSSLSGLQNRGRSTDKLNAAATAPGSGPSAFDVSSTTGSASSSQSTFLVAPAVSISGAPTSVAVGDLNNDGKLDLVVANSSAAIVTVLLGKGDGGFQAAVNYPVGRNPSSMVIGDFNGDGKLDVAVANQAGNTISVLLGNGDGTLQKAVNYQGVSGPVYLVAGDFNGDGYPDLAAANSGNSSISVLLNKGDGTFEVAAASYKVGAGPKAIVAADLNGDGHLDLATANSDGTLSILMGKGDGTFRPTSSFSVGSTSLSSIGAGDFNGDGKPDLAVGNTFASVSVLLGNGDGTFQTGETYPVGNGPAFLVVGDVNGDGVPDVLSANKSGNTVSVLLGNANGTFQRALHFTVGDSPVALAIGDFNGDGHPDLVTANFSDHTLSVPLGNGDGTFKAAREYVAQLERESIASGDLDGDGNIDLVVTNYCGTDETCASEGTATVLLSDARGSYKEGGTYLLGKGPLSVVLADVNGDKKLDLVAANRSDNTVVVLLGNGDGTFQPAVSYPAGYSPIALVVGDFNKDGKLDLAVADQCGSAGCSDAGAVTVLSGNGDGSFQTTTSYAVGYFPSALAVGALDAHGHLGLIVANRCGKSRTCNDVGTASVLLGDNKGGFTLKDDIPLGKQPSSIALGDMNGDGRLDLVVANRDDNNVAVLMGNGDGTFKTPVTYPVGKSPSSVVVADFGGVGTSDLAVANLRDSTVSLLRGKGDGTLRSAVNYPVGRNPQALVAADLSQTGRIDLVSANGNADATSAVGNDITVLRNLALSAPVGKPANITPFLGTPQDAVVNEPYGTDLAALVTDKNGVPVPNIQVTFQAPTKGASGTFVNGTTTDTEMTSANGVATATTFTANGTAGALNPGVQATVVGVAAPATFLLTNVTAGMVTATAGTPQSAVVKTAYPTNLQATVTDVSGKKVPNIQVTFQAPTKGASGTFVNGTTTDVEMTNANGVAMATTFTANGTAGALNPGVQATVVGVAAPATFLLTNVTAGTVTATAGTPQSAVINTAYPTNLQATVTDASGNKVPNIQVTFQAPTKGASGTFVNGTTTDVEITNANGVATATTFTANGTAGALNPGVQATVVGVVAPATFLLTNVTAGTVTATAGTPQSAVVKTAYPKNLLATVTDASGKKVPNIQVTFQAPTTGASGTFVNGTTTDTEMTNANGVATATTFTANGTAGALNPGVQATVVGVAAPATFLLTNVTAGTVTATTGTPQSAVVKRAYPTNLQAMVTDASGNKVPNIQVTFHAPTTGASGTFVNGTRTDVEMTNANGVATATTFTANGTAGALNPGVQATVVGVAAPATFLLTNVTAGTVTATAGAEQSAVVSTAFLTNLQATVTDASGKKVPNIQVTFQAPTTGASGTFANGTTTDTEMTNANGVATATTFTANGTARSYTVTGAVHGVSIPCDFPLTNLPGKTIITATAGGPQTTNTGTEFPNTLAATVTDGSGNAVQGAFVTFAAPSSGASGTFANGNVTDLEVTNAKGVATATTFTANGTAGSYQVTASLGVNTINPALYALINAGSPASVTVSQGSGQNANVGKSFATPLEAQVFDKLNNLVPNVTVTFTAPGSGPSVTFSDTSNNVTTAKTGTSKTGDGPLGLAVASTFTANSQAGNYTVAGTANGVGTAAMYSLTNKDFSTALSAGSLTVAQGQGTANTLILTSLFGYTGTNLMLSCSGTGSPVFPGSCTLPSNSVNVAAYGKTPAQVNIATPSTTPAAQYGFTVTANDPQGPTHQASFNLNVCQFAVGQVSQTGPSTYQFNVAVTPKDASCPWKPVVASGTSVSISSGGGASTGNVTFQTSGGTMNSSDTINVNFTGGGTPYTVGSVAVGLIASGTSVIAGGSIGPVPLTFTGSQSAAGEYTLSCNLTGTEANGMPVSSTDPKSLGIGCEFDPTSPPSTVMVPATGTEVNHLTIQTTGVIALRRGDGLKYLAPAYALGMALPGIVLLGIPVAGSRRKKFGRSTTLTLLGILLVIGFLVIAPACGGGFQANFPPSNAIGTPAGSYVMAVVATNNSQTSHSQFAFSVPFVVQASH
jgi:hypothetical protein